MIKPAARVASSRKDVWSIVNEAANMAAAAGRPVINLGQGFLYLHSSFIPFHNMLGLNKSLTPLLPLREADTTRQSS